MSHIIVTGAASGIGLSTASLLAPDVEALTLIDRDRGNLEAAVEILQGKGKAKIGAMALDLLDEGAIPSIIPGAVTTRGPITGLVHCAGIAEVKPFAELTDEEWDLTFAVNSRSTFSLVRSVGAHMSAEAGGSIVTLASVAAMLPRPQFAHYAASKAAVISLTMTAAHALAPRVRVNSVAPGIVETNMRTNVDNALANTRGVSLSRINEELLAAIPLARTALPDDIAKVICFLLSDAACYVTGQCLRVDGGMTMHM